METNERRLSKGPAPPPPSLARQESKPEEVVKPSAMEAAMKPVNGESKQRRSSDGGRKPPQTPEKPDQSRSKSVEGKNRNVEEKRKSAPIKPVENIEEWKKPEYNKQSSLEEKQRYVCTHNYKSV